MSLTYLMVAIRISALFSGAFGTFPNKNKNVIDLRQHARLFSPRVTLSKKKKKCNQRWLAPGQQSACNQKLRYEINNKWDEHRRNKKVTSLGSINMKKYSSPALVCVKWTRLVYLPLDRFEIRN